MPTEHERGGGGDTGYGFLVAVIVGAVGGLLLAPWLAKWLVDYFKWVAGI